MARTRRRRPPGSVSAPVAPPAPLPDLPAEVLAPATEWPRPGGDQVEEGREVPGDRAQERPIRVDPPPPPPRVRRPSGAEGPGALAVPSPPPVAPDRASAPVRGVVRAPGRGGSRAALPAAQSSGGVVDWLIRRVTGDDPRPSASPVNRDLPRNYRELEPGQGWGLYVPPVRSVGEAPDYSCRCLAIVVVWSIGLWTGSTRSRRYRAGLSCPRGSRCRTRTALPEGSPRFVNRNAGTPPSESLDELRHRQFEGLRHELLPGVLGRSAGDPPRLIRPDASSRPMLPDELSLEQFERLRRRVMVEADQRRGIGSNRGPDGSPPRTPPRPPQAEGPPMSLRASLPARLAIPTGHRGAFPGPDGRSGVRTELDELLERLERLERGPRSRGRPGRRDAGLGVSDGVR